MRVGGRLLAVACVLAVLAGCATTPPFVDDSTLLTTEVSADSPPAFLEQPQDLDHPLPPDVADDVHVDPENARYQGIWYGEDVYLYFQNGRIGMIGVDPDDPSTWHSGAGLGNTPLAWESGDTSDEQWTLQYLPQGTADLPDGWTAFSPYLAAA